MNILVKIQRIISKLTELSKWPFLFKYFSTGLVSLFYTVSKNGVPIIKLKNGIVLHTDGSTADMDIFREVFVQKYHKNKLINYSSISTMLDLGANKGYVSLLVASLNENTKIVCLEPEENNFKYLLKNIKQNSLTGRIIPIKKGVWSSVGTLKLYVSKDSAPNHSLFEDSIESQNMQVEEIETTTISDVLKTENISKVDYLKIDIEGAEYEVMFNLEKDILKEIKYIHIECHPTKEYKKEDMLEFLENKGFKCTPVYKGEQVFICVNEGAAQSG